MGGGEEEVGQLLDLVVPQEADIPIFLFFFQEKQREKWAALRDTKKDLEEK